MASQPLFEKKPGGVRRILLADDNSVSRKVAVRMLTHLGYQVEAVSNGQDALRAAERGLYDLIVLDTHLPEMDGYAVTRAIRGLPQEAAHRVPVIALISGSTRSDRELREAAGIDDYIAKPLHVRPLAAVIGRWDNAQGTVPPPMSIDRDALYSCLSGSGDQHPTELQELLDLFLGSTPPRLSEMWEALGRGDARALLELAHGVLGSSAQVGATSIAQTCASIGTLVRTGSLQGVRELLEQLERDFERARQDMQTIAREGFNERRVERAPHDRTAPDLAALHRAFSGKRVMAHTDREAGIKLDEAFTGICRVEHISDPAAAGTADLLFWQGNLDVLGRLREEGLRVPVIVLASKPELGLLERLPALDADFVGEPFNPDDLLLRACLRFNNADGWSKGNGASVDRVLVAEDEPLIARFLVSNLEGAGFQVTQVVDGDAALEALGKERFGLVVLDINMPKTDGFGVLSQLRLRPKSRSTPVLILSARTQEHDIVKAFDLGADDYVTKPFNPLELVFRARRLMRHH